MLARPGLKVTSENGWVGLGSCRLHHITGKTDSGGLAGIGEFRCDKILHDVSRKAFQATSYGITTSGCMCRFLRHLLIVSVIIGMLTIIPPTKWFFIIKVYGIQH